MIWGDDTNPERPSPGLESVAAVGNGGIEEAMKRLPIPPLVAHRQLRTNQRLQRPAGESRPDHPDSRARHPCRWIARRARCEHVSDEIGARQSLLPRELEDLALRCADFHSPRLPYKSPA